MTDTWTCIGCGCTNEKACPGGCSWVRGRPKSYSLICSRCFVPGAVFSTEFETNCVVKSSPDASGSFLGLDTDGVECSFGLDMIKTITPPALAAAGGDAA